MSSEWEWTPTTEVNLSPPSSNSDNGTSGPRDEIGLLLDLPSAPRSAPLDAEAITEIDLGSLLEVYWDDAVSQHGWRKFEEIDTKAEACVSVGWLVSRDAKAITLASTTGADIETLGDINGTITLPIGMVTGFRVLD